MTRSTQFCAVWLTSLVAILVLVATVNVLVDPYDIMDTPRVGGLNKFKVVASEHAALVKSYQITRVRPVTVLLGSSLVNGGMNPENPVWPVEMRPVYNFGVPWMQVGGIYRELRYAASIGTVRNAVIVLQFDSFLTSASAAEDFGVPRNAHSIPRPEDLLRATLTLSALEDSVATMLHQRDPVHVDIAPDGATGGSYFRQLAAMQGEATLFAESETFETESLNKIAAIPRLRDGLLANLNVVSDMIAFCDNRGIGLTLVLPPAHAKLLNAIYATGLWGTYESWKVSLARLASTHRDAPIPLWDFNSYTPYTTEPVPTRSGTAITAWFWDIVHFKPRLGELIASRILTGKPSDFGILLSSENVADQLTRERSARDDSISTSAASSNTPGLL